MFTYIDLRENPESIKSPETTYLSQLSHIMDQFVDFATNTHTCLRGITDSLPKYEKWHMFKAGELFSKVRTLTDLPRL